MNTHCDRNRLGRTVSYLLMTNQCFYTSSSHLAKDELTHEHYVWFDLLYGWLEWWIKLLVIISKSQLIGNFFLFRRAMYECVGNFHVCWKQAGWWRAGTGAVRCRKRSLTNCFGESAGRCRDHIPTNWSRSRAVGNAARDTPHDGRGPAHTFAATERQRCRLSSPINVPNKITLQVIIMLTVFKRLDAVISAKLTTCHHKSSFCVEATALRSGHPQLTCSSQPTSFKG